MFTHNTFHTTWHLALCAPHRKLVIGDDSILKFFGHNDSNVRRLVMKLFLVIAAETENSEERTYLADRVFAANVGVEYFEVFATVTQIYLVGEGGSWQSFWKKGGGDLLVDRICCYSQRLYRADSVYEKIERETIEADESALLACSVILMKMLSLDDMSEGFLFGGGAGMDVGVGMAVEGGGQQSGGAGGVGVGEKSSGGISALTKLTLAREVLTSIKHRESEKLALCTELLSSLN